MKSRRFIVWLRYLLTILFMLMTAHTLMAEPYVYTANFGNSTVSVIDSATDTLISTIALPVNSKPDQISLNPANNTIYTLNTGTNSVSVIDTVTRNVVTTITSPAFTGLAGITCNLAGTRVYVTNSDPDTSASTVYVIDTSSNAVFPSSITVGSNPGGIVFNADGSKAFVLNQGVPSISVIDTSTLQVTGTIALEAMDAPAALAIHAKSKYLYVTNLLSNSVSLFNPVSLSGAGRINVGSFPYAIAASNLTNLLYIANNGSDTVSVADSQSRSVTGSFATVAPQALVELTDGKRIYVLSMLDNIVRSYDTQNLLNSPTQIPLPPGSSPHAIATDLGARHQLSVSVSGNGSGTVSSFVGPINIDYPHANGDSAKVFDGAEVSIVAAAPDSTVTWTGCDSVTGAGSQVATCKVSPLRADRAVNTVFTQIPFNVTASAPGGNGTVVCVSPVTYNNISKCSITPNSGYHLASLMDNGADVMAAIVDKGTYNIGNVNANHQITASFTTYAIGDVLVALKAAVGLVSPTQADKIWLDVAPLDVNSRPQGNGVVDMDDALILLRRTVGLYNW